jgi:hypothetical protein
MPNIRHAILINAAPEKIYSLVSNGSGLAQWWAEDVSEDSTTGLVELGFFRRATVYRLAQTQTTAHSEVEWLCQSGKEWNGTTIRFRIAADDGRTLLRFDHLHWEYETDYFISCNTVWGGLLFRLKAAAEGKAPGPLFSAAGMAY